METKQLLELLKSILEKDINKLISLENHADYTSQIIGDLKRIYCINKELEKISEIEYEHNRPSVTVFEYLKEMEKIFMLNKC